MIMIFNSTILTPAYEAINYENIKNNYCFHKQDHLRLPMGDGNAIFMLSPSRQASLKIISEGFPLFYKCGYRLYTTDTKLHTVIGRKTINLNKEQDYKVEFKKTVNNPAIKFFSLSMKDEVLSKKKSFIYDMGEIHKLYFSNRIVKAVDFLCVDYVSYILRILDTFDLEEYSKKIIYISLSEWNKVDCKYGLTKDVMDNPVSVFLRSMLKKPNLVKEFIDRGFEFMFVNEDKHEFIKLDLKGMDIEGSNENKVIYNRFRNQMSKMDIGKIITEDTTEEKIENYEESKKIADEMKRNLTGTNTIRGPKKASLRDSIKAKDFNVVRTSLLKNGTDKSLFEDLMIDEEDEEEKNIEDILNSDNTEDGTDEEVVIEEDEEIKDTIDNFVNSENGLTPDMTDEEKKEAIENEVKQKVYIAKFYPEKSAKQLKYIDKQTGIQNQILHQSVDELKSKIIDEVSIENVVDTTNEDIKTIKYANSDRNYVEKKYQPDINNAVAKMSDADVKVFIDSIEEVDSSDQMNQKKTLTYNLVDENGKKHTLTFDVPIIIDGCYMFLGGARKVIQHQRIFKPVVKIRPDTCQVVTFYNKIQIERYGSANDRATTNMKKFVSKNDYFKVKTGNARAKNAKYKTSLEFDDYARAFTEISFINKNKEKVTIYFDLPAAEEEFKQLGNSKNKDFSEELYFVKVGNSFIYLTETLTSFIKDSLPDNISKQLETSSGSGNSRPAYARAKILNKFIPLILFMLFCEGFTSVMRKCKIEYKVFANKKEALNYYQSNTIPDDKGFFKTADAFIVYDAMPYENSILMNGLNNLKVILEEYTLEELDSKDTYIDFLSIYYASSNQAKNLDKFRMFLIDKKTEEILKDFNLPTDLIELLFYVCKLLTTNQYLPETDLNNMRIRSNEIVSQIVYQYVVEAYSKFLNTQNRRRPEKITMPKDAVIKALLSSSLVDDASVVNPIYTLEKTRACTIKASTSAKNITLTGINKTDGYTMEKRAYNQSMTGTFGLTSPADANVGIVRELTLEPAITSTNGYIDVSVGDDLESLNAANLFTAVELLTPPGVLHDDPQRSAMMRSQSSKMVMTDYAQPVLMGNKVESIIPYHMNNDFCFTSKEDGKVIDMQDGIYVVQYKSGKYDSFDTNERVMKNSSDGSYTRIKFDTRVKVGDTFKANEILAVEPRAMTFNRDDKGASCNIGVLAKVAIMSLYDVFEDSEPVTASLSRKLGYWAITKKTVTLSANTFVDKIVNIGDHVDIGNPLITFDSSRGDPEVQRYLDNLRKGMKDSGIVEELVQSNNTVAKSPTTGEITDIVIYSTVPVEELSDTLQKIIKKYHKRIENTEKFLDKYKNKGDNKYYKCGRLLTETVDTVEAKYGKVKGEQVDDGVIIEFYIKHHDIIKKGDKMTNYVALKGVNSHVIPEGLEPWSENNPDEEVSCFITPISITARKTPSIFIPMFGNKVLIEAKRQMVKKYKEMKNKK